ncbi:MAG: dihydrodipicolinate reductase C-terminal domain-containing protein, partial [Bdellovibrionota bacterium]
KVLAFSDEEVISLEHQALNRAVFAKGAVVAANWLIKQKPGLYKFENIF